MGPFTFKIQSLGNAVHHCLFPPPFTTIKTMHALLERNTSGGFLQKYIINKSWGSGTRNLAHTFCYSCCLLLLQFSILIANHHFCSYAEKYLHTNRCVGSRAAILHCCEDSSRRSRRMSSAAGRGPTRQVIIIEVRCRQLLTGRRIVCSQNYWNSLFPHHAEQGLLA